MRLTYVHRRFAGVASLNSSVGTRSVSFSFLFFELLVAIGSLAGNSTAGDYAMPIGKEWLRNGVGREPCATVGR